MPRSLSNSYSIEILYTYARSYMYIHAGTDYIVNTLNTSSRIFTVTFQPKQDKSNEHVILIADDNILENKEYFIIRIYAIRFIEGAATRFTISSEANRSFAVVVIQDDDSEFRSKGCTIFVRVACYAFNAFCSCKS